jgi:YidC/Oxa1 family membrane protein insertase
MNSTHTSYRPGAFDEFDTILCVGPHHVSEIRRTEEVYGLPPKELIEHGSVKLDTLIAEVGDRAGPRPPSASPEVLVAPTWGESSLIEQPLGREVISSLLGAGYRTVLRLHPMTVRRLPSLVADLRGTFGQDNRFTIEEEMSATESWLRSDVMVSDWSGAASEYALALFKPVVFIDTPPKIMNPRWSEIGLEPLESRIRSFLGQVAKPTEVGDLPSHVGMLLREADSVRRRCAWVRRDTVFNVGSSPRVAAQTLIGLGRR